VSQTAKTWGILSPSAPPTTAKYRFEAGRPERGGADARKNDAMTEPPVTADPERARPFRGTPDAESHPLHMLALYAGDLAMARLRLEELAARLVPEEGRTRLGEEHSAIDLPTEVRRVIHCVVQDHLTPAIDDLLSFLMHPLDEDPREVS
jgi:hypothetical protein